MEDYQEHVETDEEKETIEALKPAIAEMKAEKGEPAEMVFAEFMKSSDLEL